MATVNAYAAKEAGGKLESFNYDLKDLGSDQVDPDQAGFLCTTRYLLNGGSVSFDKSE